MSNATLHLGTMMHVSCPAVGWHGAQARGRGGGGREGGRRGHVHGQWSLMGCATMMPLQASASVQAELW